VKNGWSGGQYSLYRAVLGSYLFVHFAQLAPWGRELFSRSGAMPDAATSPLYPLFPNILFLFDSAAFVTSLIVVAATLGLMLAVGWHDRVAAVGLWYVLACLYVRNPLISNPSLPFIGWLLLAHVAIPRSPYGSWSARGRTDPAGGWSMPPRIFGAAWVVMAAGYTYSGYTKLVSSSWIDGSAIARVLDSPLARPGLVHDLLSSLPAPLLQVQTWGTLALEVLFLPLALISRARPWLWGLMLLMHLGLMIVIDFVDLSFGMVVLHLFTFDPTWVAPAGRGGQERVFYDGSCGLCHRTVRFILAEEPSGERFRFAPLEGETFSAEVAEEQRGALPDSIVLKTGEGRLLMRSAAVLHMLRGLGGVWRCLATLAGVVPAGMLDRLYDGVAAVRHRVFRRPEAACPILPAALLERFDP